VTNPAGVPGAELDFSGTHDGGETSAGALMRRFERSMILDFDKWHDGAGYDLAALRAMPMREKSMIEARLIQRGARDWRDLEALAVLDTPQARDVLVGAMDSSNPEVRNTVTRCAPHLISESVRTASLVRGLETANFFGGLAQVLEQVASFHPPLVVEALLRGALDRAGAVAVHFAAMLLYVCGQSKEPFDPELRLVFLEFESDLRGDREKAFRDLCRRIGVEAAGYLPAESIPSS